MEPQEATQKENINNSSVEVKNLETKTQGLNIITILSMALFVLLTLSAIAFLYYQNQELKKMVMKYQETPQPTATATPVVQEESDLPKVVTPEANTKVSSPLEIKGTVPPGWMFEGSFPIKLVDSERKLIAQGTAKEVKKGSWQSGKDVEFSVTLPFSTTDKAGFLILSNDNPSGDPENDKTFEVPLKF
jgi:hypothetical protein